jgi:polyvinyl alcohol dehydrogenase (cytochrome)
MYTEERNRRARSRPRIGLLRILAGALLSAGVLAGCASGTQSTNASTASVSSWDWPTYGHDAQHTFHGVTTLTDSSVQSLAKAWEFPTGDSVTATPTVVGDTVYVGSWDDYFYAVNLETGKLRWKTKVASQDGVHPYPGENPRDISSDGGLITSSAWYQPASGSRPPLVIFGGGYTLYALDANNGTVYWKQIYSGRAGKPDPDTDDTRIFSSPVVSDGLVLFGVDVDGQSNSKGYIAAASLATGEPVWEYQTDVNSKGQVLNDGCGSVWSSGTILPSLGLVVYGTADCNFENHEPYAIVILALHITTGKLAWVYRPSIPNLDCDFDFGATANAGVDAQGNAVFLGEGGKDGTYYSLDPSTGKLRWETNVVFGGFSGGFIGTTAYDGTGVYGATAIGDFGRFESNGPGLCDPSNPADTQMQNPGAHAFDAGTGAIVWQQNYADSFSPTTVAGGMTFNGLALSPTLQVRDAKTGALIVAVHLPQDNWSGIATVGDALVLGLGSTYTPKAAGIEVLTPGGRPPVVPTGN